ncbi:MAG: FHA domain-containing protein [Fimbriimonadaceae bacterium]
MGQVFFRAIACGAAGLLAWLITEPFAPRFLPSDPTQAQAGGQDWLILLIGALVGLTAGALHGVARGSRRHAIESGLLGLFFGAIGSTLGASVGTMLSAMIMDVPRGGIAMMEMPGRMIARALALFPIGLFMGIAIGATLKSKRGLIAGLFGGMVGGVFVGFAFDTLAGMIAQFMVSAQAGVEPPPGMLTEIGGPSRAILAVGLGVAVGLFVAVFDRVTRQAWVRLVLGRNEGKEWPIDNDRTMIGRDERAHVPLFGDMNVAPLHAIIFRQGSQYVVQDQGTAIGIGWNGQRVPTAQLSPGDTFQIGGHNLQFLMKDSAARALEEGRARGVPVGAPMQQPVQPIQLGQPNTQPYQQPDFTGHVEPIQQPYQSGGMQYYAVPGQPAPQQSQQTQAFPSGAAGAAPSPVLVATSGPLTGQRFDLFAPLEVGREGAGIALVGDANASRKHALFSPTALGVQVQDLGSTNGTFVNGGRVQTAQLNRGDTVTIGNSSFRVE